MSRKCGACGDGGREREKGNVCNKQKEEEMEELEGN